MITRSPDARGTSPAPSPRNQGTGHQGTGQRLSRPTRRLGAVSLLGVGAGAAALAVLPAAPGLAATAAATPYTQTNLVSDIPGVARITDPHLVNPWGASEPPGGPLWVSDNGTAVSTLYTGAVGGSALKPVPLVVKVPGAVPTGQVFNGNSKAFIVHHGKQKGAALFLFAGLSGVISGWNPAVGAASATATSTQAQVGTTVKGAAYTGLALAGNHLYAADFAKGKVDEFGPRFKKIRSFGDAALPKGFAPFNTASIGGDIYVSFAKANPKTGREILGAGKGYVDVFSPSGKLLHRLIRRGALNAPWAIVTAPASFGTFSNDLLVGNFGNGHIDAYNPKTGKFLGALRNGDGNVIAIQGLWDLIPGDGAASNAQTLLFTAGIGHEAHGLLGTIAAGS
jgi:uncharacterized protein (TIGR03118 family)